MPNDNYTTSTYTVGTGTTGNTITGSDIATGTISASYYYTITTGTTPVSYYTATTRTTPIRVDTVETIDDNHEDVVATEEELLEFLEEKE